MSAKEEYLEIIEKFISATRSRKFNWKRQSPTTLYLHAESSINNPAIISLQKVQESVLVKVLGQKNVMKMVNSYVFTVKNVNNQELIIQIDSKNEKVYSDNLEELFELADYNIEKKNIDFLKGIIKDI